MRCSAHTTEQSAPDWPIGTFSLAVLPLELFPFAEPTRFSSSARKTGSDSRLLCTGHRMASKQVPSMLFPEQSVCPGFGATMVLFRCFIHRFAFARLSDPHMT